ncbi:FAD-binding protein [Streptomyces sp. NPDC098789]|uniref:FAD-dependent oxidoreductase n=1 Tax=Streptomyces sp. NPDC098789 TaxID=3366098 RepID=UPI0037F9E1D0
MTTSSLAALASSFAGELIGPDDPRYDTARRLFSGDVDKRPSLIARCTGARDVAAALHHARENGLEVAVRGGGHSSAGYSSSEGGVMVDVSPMKSVEIDAEARTGRFGAGLTWGELDGATQQFGLAVTGGRVSHTGVGGLTLGSGSGWLERACGPTPASLLSARMVTADGRTVRAAADENADLLWGLRGGGGNFGVVTEFEFRLHPVGPIVLGGMILHPASASRSLARFYRDFMRQAPDEVGGALAVITAPPANFIAADDPATRLRSSFGPEKFARLVALKDAYDPDNVFALNQNIPPSAPA